MSLESSEEDSFLPRALIFVSVVVVGLVFVAAAVVVVVVAAAVVVVAVVVAAAAVVVAVVVAAVVVAAVVVVLNVLLQTTFEQSRCLESTQWWLVHLTTFHRRQLRLKCCLSSACHQSCLWRSGQFER